MDAFYQEIFDESKKMCMVKYEKPSADDAYHKMFADLKFNMSMAKLNKLKKLVYWRDRTARLEDESREYILPDELLQSFIQETPVSWVEESRVE